MGARDAHEERDEAGFAARHFAGTSRFRRGWLLGSGSMGEVYRVHDEELGCDVALKTLRELTAEQIYRLKTEFRSISGVVHPNLVQLHDLIVTDDECFFTMELVDGSDFLEFVRSGGTGDPAGSMLDRFASAAPQLVSGVAALHAAGRLHRDIKPSNVRVTVGGRVVLLDFDLVIPLVGGHGEDEVPGGLAGTFAYMAPEQAWGTPVGTAADLYAVGVVFFEALAGRLPCDGSPAEMLASKTSSRVPDLHHFAPDVPDSLCELTGALLHAEPERRPSAAEVLARLGSGSDRAASSITTAVSPPFVGRRRELDELRAWAASARSRPVVASIRGASGIGKTQLVRQLLIELGDDETLVLSGRCHAQEALAYKAIDPLVDGISRYLVQQPEDAVRRVLPRDVAALVRLFPVLSRVSVLAQARSPGEQVDTVEIRQRGFAALRDLLVSIAKVKRLVLWIDDLQWGDVDSASLLVALMSPPDPPPLLLLLSHREDQAARSLLANIVASCGQPDSARVNELELGPLEPRDSEELAGRLVPHADAALLAEQAGGSPFLLAELVRYGSPRGGGAFPGRVQLDDVIRARVSQIDPAARQIVELVAVAGSPIDRSVLLQAAAHGEAGRPLVARLEAECLVRSCSIGERPAVEAYHDRIRESVLETIPERVLGRCHRDLAVALETSGRGAPEALARHFHGAGVSAKAADYAVAAADHAMDALAFTTAAEFYTRARTWDPRDADWQRVLLTKEGEALASAARFNEGARAFLGAADGAARDDALDLRRRAAENFFAGGRFDEAVEVLGALLRDLDVPYPRTPRRALLRTLGHLARLLIGGIRYGAHAAPARREDLVRIDTCYSVGRTLVMSDSTLGVYFSFEALARALRSSDPVRLGRTLCVVGGSLAAAGGRSLAALGERMLRLADEIAAETQSPLLRGTILVGTGQVAMIRGRWRLALERCDAGAKLLAETCRGVAFDCNIGRGNAQRALEELGDVDELEVRARDFLHATMTTGARYAEIAASQHLSMALLARDDSAGARPLARKGQEMWSRSGFHMQHFYSIRQEAYCDLYDGDPAPSHERLEQTWPELKRSNLLRISLTRIDALSLRARVSLASAAAAGADAARAGSLLKSTVTDARSLAAEGRADALVYAELALAGAAATAGDGARAVKHLEAAEVAAAQAEMPLLAACARFRRGEVLGGGEGDELRAAAAAKLRQSGVRRPAAWVGLLAPGRWGSA